jgi:hypothetical protein
VPPSLGPFNVDDSHLFVEVEADTFLGYFLLEVEAKSEEIERRDLKGG